MPPRKSQSDPVQVLQAGLLLQQAQRLWDEGKLQEALQASNQVLRMDENHAGALYMMGMLALKLGALDIAIGSLERAAANAPGTVRVLVGLGQAHMDARQPVKAATIFNKAIQLDGKSAAAYRGLGLAQMDMGQRDMALKSFRKALKLKPDDDFSSYVIAALSSDTPAVPRGYVPALFDGYAEEFDLHLTTKLRYHVPEEIAALVKAQGGLPLGSAVDIGCGTGLVGAALGDSVTAIDGIDLSPKMLEKAEARGLYRTLAAGDATELLDSDPRFAGPYDLVTSADVFIYVGALEPIFTAVKAQLVSGGLFAFSVEELEAGTVDIRSSGRFAHSPAYIESLATRFGFAVLARKDVVIREEINVPLPGQVYLLQAE